MSWSTFSVKLALNFNNLMDERLYENDNVCVTAGQKEAPVTSLHSQTDVDLRYIFKYSLTFKASVVICYHFPCYLLFSLLLSQWLLVILSLFFTLMSFLLRFCFCFKAFCYFKNFSTIFLIENPQFDKMKACLLTC